MDELRVSDALEEIVQLARYANKYIDVSEPWGLNKDEAKKDVLNHVLYHLVETIRFIAVLLQPFIPETASKIADQLNIKNLSFESLDTFGVYETQTLGKGTPLFERYDLDLKIQSILDQKKE